MKAELDYIHGKPVLRFQRGGGRTGVREVFDLELTPEQERKLKVNGVEAR
jgi:hypothetical protein